MGDRGSEIISPALKVLAALSREVSVSLGFILRYDSGCLSSLEHRPSLPQMVIQQLRDCAECAEEDSGWADRDENRSERDAMRSGFALQASGGQHHLQRTPEALYFLL